ncbi:hypothetical protein PV08_02391 [Exophiala spinifera]|uniref:WW domain-containing protein n=1 Tax=Exophiala spinifera TaxID=91928 RepID=A0A0D2C3C0_9EURO|nr:uncharacterized protein PV08_02391 [Exophiala spinifera]KIW18104.1 hypothetical protein PV08_02391 [Exophiala spinifera]
MADFAPPPGPPPPKVPEGWKAVFNDQYQTWFYVNTYTKKSTWDKPTEPARPPVDDDAPPGAPPPSYSAGPGSHNVSDVKRRSFESNNPYKQGHETDEEYARRLQAEENTRGQSDSYYNQGGSGGGHSPNPPGLQGGYPGGPSPTSPGAGGAGAGGKRGFFSKLMGKPGGGSGSNSPYPQHAPPGSGYPPQPAGYQQGYPPQGPGYGGPGGYGGGPPGGGYGAPGGYGGYGGGGYGPPGGGYGYGQPQYVQQAPPRRSGGIGAGGAAALGLGGGLLGGMLLGEAIDGGDGGGGDDGGDYGGDDGGGGDF